jgi:hypothetical protein
MSKISDNYHEDFPARMSDGRFITNYHPNCEMNGEIQQNMTSWQYRTFLTRYTDNLMDQTNQINNKLYGCDTCDKVSLPNKSKQLCTPNGCQINVVNKDGLGLDQEN